MDDHAGGWTLADRYRMPPRLPAQEYPSGAELVETRAIDTCSGQQVLVRQVPLPKSPELPEVVSAEYSAGHRAEPGDCPSYHADHEVTGSARRALDAARAAAEIPDHPRLVQVFDIFTEAGSLWVVSELVAARPLAALLAEKRLSPYRAAEIASDVLIALRAVHAHGWAHRNVTAATVLVCDDGRAMLGGFAVGAAQEALCARARQARITVVGAVAERWAPEQAAETPDNRLPAPPVVGPAADLWALGSLLFRSVQGHPPFPEENAAELVRLVCSEPPAFADECGPLRPVAESLLRQDPGRRCGPGELSGRLRSLIRAAPEPGLGLGGGTVPLPSGDRHRLPVGKRRDGKRSDGSPRSLGLVLLGLVLLLLAAVVTYAVLFMPRTTPDSGPAADPLRTIPAEVGGGNPGDTADDQPQTATTGPQAPQAPQATSAAHPAGLGAEFRLVTDPAGYSVAVPASWQRHGENARGQIRYTGGDCTMTVVPGRDSVADFGSDPLAYQSDQEPELDAFHASDWSSVFGVRPLDLHGDSAAEGEYTWRDTGGRTFYARNLAVIVDGRYHIILVTGPQAHSADVKRYFEEAARTYRTT